MSPSIWRDDLSTTPKDALTNIQEAITTCCQPEAFTNSIDHLRSATERDADIAIMLMTFMNSHRGSTHILPLILNQFFKDGDRSHFGAINAITAVARDTTNPQTRWQLEEYAGSLALLKTPPPAWQALQRAPTRRPMALSSR